MAKSKFKLKKNRGNAWKTEKAKRKENPKYPLYKGKVRVGKKEYWVSIWHNESDTENSPDLDIAFTKC